MSSLIELQMNASANQVDKVLEGLEDEQWDAKVRDDCMSPRETVAHFSECYVAAVKHLDGEKHEWGSFVANSDSPNSLMAEMRGLRKVALERLTAAANEDAVKTATEYVLLHDAYHVGQLVTLRIGLDPKWDAYSIYG